MATQNKQIKVSKDTVIKSFTNEIQVDYTPTSTLQKYDLNSLANQYRSAYPPVFADDSWYLPTGNMAQAQQPIVSEPMATDSVTIATAPIAQSIAQTISNVTSGQPITNQQKDDIGKALLIALGIFVLIKIVS